jgi:hypothetical protein
MCYFVFVGLPEAQQPLLVERITKAGFEVRGTSNSAVRAAFPKNDVVSVITRGGCSCDICGEPTPAFDEDAERAKYQKKNWSPAKIERAILGKRPLERPVFASFRDSFVQVLHASGAARLLAHSFSGDVETEDVTVRGSRPLPLDQYLQDGGAYEVDVIHNVRAG